MAKLKILTLRNSKMGDCIPQLNMPAGHSCRPNAPCACICYAMKGNVGFKSTKQAHMQRLELYKENPAAFFEQIEKELEGKNYEYFRFHSSGDFPDAEYLRRACGLAATHPDTLFLAFSKKFELVNAHISQYGPLPPNFTIILSTFGKWIPKNPHNLPTAWVRFKRKDQFHMNEPIPADGFVCPKHCEQCPGHYCWRMKHGDSVIFDKH